MALRLDCNGLIKARELIKITDQSIAVVSAEIDKTAIRDVL